MEKLQYFLIWMVPLLFSLSFHEFAHAWFANRYGDPTAKLMGRMTLNPTAHIDPIGTILFPTLSFFTGMAFLGWANPVMVNERNLRNPVRDGMIVAAAGPGSNIFLAFMFAAVIFSLGLVNLHFGFMEPLKIMLVTGIKLNIFLAFFNLLPFPPLDGGRIVYGLFPNLRDGLDWLSRYGFLILMLLLYTGILNVLLMPAHILSNSIIGWVI